MLDCQPGDLLEWVAESTATADHVPKPSRDARMKDVVAVLSIAVGAAGVVAGGADDSPGLQLWRPRHRRDRRIRTDSLRST